MRVTIAQLNPTVGDLEGNREKIQKTLDISKREKPDIVVFPELFLTGYPPRDLLQKPSFIQKVQEGIHDVVRMTETYDKMAVLFGAPLPTGKDTGNGLYNSAVLACEGRIEGYQYKTLLPTYDVFDETRYFDPSPRRHVVAFRGHRLGISICEDAWNNSSLWHGRRYDLDPIDEMARMGADVFLNISASPFQVDKEEARYHVMSSHAKRHGIPLLYINQVGGNDELIFDGRSMGLDNRGEPISLLPSFREHICTIDTRQKGIPSTHEKQEKNESVYEALVLGIRDYMRKCGFQKALIGLSGGIDSALTCCLACEAVGFENVCGITMPSPYSSEGSVNDSQKLAHNLGIRLMVIPITHIFNSYHDTLHEPFKDTKEDVTEENIQARIRGNILMAFSNRYGYLVLSTGNKSELAMGYCTLYGDMSGGLAVLSDVPKTMVYELAHHANRRGEVIPRAVFEKPPSAELRPGQKDEDTLPPYPLLDEILYYYIEETLSENEIVNKGYDSDIVHWVIERVDKNEYKRRQMPPGLRVTSKAFGQGRRMPIAARY